MFSSGSLRSISLATVTPSLVMVGDPNFLSITTLRPLGPSVTFTASASLLTPRINAWRASSLYTICLPGMAPVLLHVLYGCELGHAFGDAQDLVLTNDQVLFAVQLDLRACVLPDQH